jgi:hypothetical protein
MMRAVPAGVLLVSFLLLLAGAAAPVAATVPRPDPKEERRVEELARLFRLPPVLTGVWRMTLPRGFQHQITLTPVGPNRFRLTPASLNSSGVYELRGGRLVQVEPNAQNRHQLGFEWEVRGGRLILVAQPPVAQTGSNYLGATLVRPDQ